ncbi:MAG: hypothetical protein JSR56_11595 [Proteobacteria bacterium]|nr:hypothetical protein [Pseudomonadota bacterium]
MKLSAISVAIALAGVVGIASAASQTTIMPSVTVSGAPVAQCTPPTADPACANFHRWIRANFTDREIGMLFGASTAYPEYATGGIDRLERRYHGKLHEYLATQQAASRAEIAVK